MKFPTSYSGHHVSYYPRMMKKPLIPKSEALPSNSQNNLESLRAKLKSGQKLTIAELEYLKSHDPNLYSKALKLEQERADYENSVRQCRTKCEVNALHDQTVMSIMHTTKDSDPEESMMRLNTIQDSHRKFIQSKEYASLDWK